MQDVGDRLANDGRMPLLVDVTKQAAVFLRYNDVNYLNVCNSRNMDSESIRLALLGAVRFGKPMVVDMMDIQYDISQLAEMLGIIPWKEALLDDIMSRRVLEEAYYLSLVDPAKDNKELFNPARFSPKLLQNFRFVVLSYTRELPKEWFNRFYTIEVVNPKQDG